MSSDFGANYADVITWDSVTAIVPDEAAAFEAVLSKYGVGWEDYLTGVAFEDDDEWLDKTPGLDDLDGEQVAAIGREIAGSWERLMKTFETATAVAGRGLTLYVDYHDKEEAGGRYDEIDGVFLGVNDVYEYTPAGRKFAGHINRVLFVSYG